jgi:hypothetical protein
MKDMKEKTAIINIDEQGIWRGCRQHAEGSPCAPDYTDFSQVRRGGTALPHYCAIGMVQR